MIGGVKYVSIFVYQKAIKLMKFNIFHLALAFTCLLSSCTEEQTDSSVTLIKGGKTYGGEVKYMSAEKVQGLLPMAVVDKYSFSITGQIFESLLKMDPNSLVVKPAIAESFEINSAGDVYRFKIRPGIKFHKDDCFGGDTRELTANDVKFSLEFACSGLELNKVGNTLVDNIKGGLEFFEKSKTSLPASGVSGIKVEGNDVVITLNKPFVGFEKVLTQPNMGIFPKEAYEKYGKDLLKHPVGTGPFMLESMNNEGIRLVKNENYWKKDSFGNKLPYLNAISMTYVSDKKSEMLAFRNKEIDLLLEIPVEEIENVLGTLQEAKDGKNVKHRLESSTSLSIEYIGFNHKSDLFGKKEVRQAFFLAINPTKIIDQKLKGEGNPPTNGFVPEMEELDNEIIPVVSDPEKARKLLASAGYPGGKGFPEIEIYVNAIKGSKIDQMMQGVVEQLKAELNVNVKIKLCDYAEREAAIASGKALIWRAGWIADYPDPASFLSLIYGNGMTANSFHFSDAKFDKNYEASLVEKNPTTRAKLLLNCAQQVIDDAMVIPIYNDNMLIMVNARVKGVTANPMELIDYTEVFIKEPREN